MILIKFNSSVVKNKNNFAITNKLKYYILFNKYE